VVVVEVEGEALGLQEIGLIVEVEVVIEEEVGVEETSVAPEEEGEGLVVQEEEEVVVEDHMGVDLVVAEIEGEEGLIEEVEVDLVDEIEMAIAVEMVIKEEVEVHTRTTEAEVLLVNREEASEVIVITSLIVNANLHEGIFQSINSGF